MALHQLAGSPLQAIGFRWWHLGALGLAILAFAYLYCLLKPRRLAQGLDAAPILDRLRDAWRRTALVWGPLFVVAGVTLTFFVTESEDPCCHVQTPGLAVSAYGAISMWLHFRRRRRFESLAAQGFNTHSFGDIEEPMAELTKKLPLIYRDRFRQARKQFRHAHRKGHH